MPGPGVNAVYTGRPTPGQTCRSITCDWNDTPPTIAEQLLLASICGYPARLLPCPGNAGR